jgi:hypothetical protein
MDKNDFSLFGVKPAQSRKHRILPLISASGHSGNLMIAAEISPPQVFIPQHQNDLCHALVGFKLFQTPVQNRLSFKEGKLFGRPEALPLASRNDDRRYSSHEKTCSIL